MEPNKHRLAHSIAIAAAVVGLVVSGVSEWIHLRAYLEAGVTSFCTLGETFDCRTVSLSRWSVIGDIPLPLWGLAGFLSLLLATVRRSALLFPLAGFAVLASIALFTLQVTSIGAICLLCEGVHLASLVVFVAAWRMRSNHALHRDLKRDFAFVILLPALLLVGLRLFMPQYWASMRWEDPVDLPTGIDDAGHPWIGAESPDVTIVEVVDYGCPHCARASARLRMFAERHPDEVRLVRAFQPRMRCRTSVSCGPLRAALCAGEQGAFWPMDAWLFAHVPGDADPDLRAGAVALGLDLEAFDTCFEAETTLQRADAFGMEAREWGITATPGYRVDDERVEPADLGRVVDEKLGG